MESRKDKAVKLRKAGYSYSYIHEVTGLAKSTLSYHLADIPYIQNEYTKIRQSKAQQKSALTKNAQKLAKINFAQKQAISEIGKLEKRDILLAGVALYAGEGSKTNNLVRLVNSDHKIIIFFIKWLGILGVPKSHIMIRIHLYPDSDVEVCHVFWQTATKLPRNQFQKPCFDKRINKDRRRIGVHKYGTAHVTVRANGKSEFGSALSRKIHAMMNILLD